MDALDVSILREMSREKVFWWGGLDPRFSVDVIARRLGVAGSTVRGRLSHWEETGFLRGYDVQPNPTLFGARYGGGSLRVDDPRKKPQVLEDLALLDGVITAVDHVGVWLALTYVGESEAAIDRQRKLVARLPGVDEAPPCSAAWAPPCAMQPRPLDWRLLGELRRDPRAPVHVLAERLGVSARTFTRRYDALVKGGALLFSPLLDFTRSPGGVVGRLLVFGVPGVPTASIVNGLRAAFPDLMELWNARAVAAPEDDIHVLLHRGTLGEMEDAQSRALDIPGVESVEVVYPRSAYRFPRWVDAKLASVTPPRPLARAPSSIEDSSR